MSQPGEMETIEISQTNVGHNDAGAAGPYPRTGHFEGLNRVKRTSNPARARSTWTLIADSTDTTTTSGDDFSDILPS